MAQSDDGWQTEGIAQDLTLRLYQKITRNFTQIIQECTQSPNRQRTAKRSQRSNRFLVQLYSINDCEPTEGYHSRNAPKGPARTLAGKGGRLQPEEPKLLDITLITRDRYK